MEQLDQFTLEIAWSESGAFPWGAFGKRKVDRANGRLRLPRLWTHGAAEFLWDVAPTKTVATKLYLESLSKERAMPTPQDMPDEGEVPRIQDLVNDAVDKLEHYGLPLFREVAKFHGLEIGD